MSITAREITNKVIEEKAKQLYDLYKRHETLGYTEWEHVHQKKGWLVVAESVLRDKSINFEPEPQYNALRPYHEEKKALDEIIEAFNKPLDADGRSMRYYSIFYARVNEILNRRTGDFSFNDVGDAKLVRIENGPYRNRFAVVINQEGGVAYFKLLSPHESYDGSVHVTAITPVGVESVMAGCGETLSPAPDADSIEAMKCQQIEELKAKFEQLETRLARYRGVSLPDDRGEGTLDIMQATLEGIEVKVNELLARSAEERTEEYKLIQSFLASRKASS